MERWWECGLRGIPQPNSSADRAPPYFRSFPAGSQSSDATREAFPTETKLQESPDMSCEDIFLFSQPRERKEIKTQEVLLELSSGFQNVSSGGGTTSAVHRRRSVDISGSPRSSYQVASQANAKRSSL